MGKVERHADVDGGFYTSNEIVIDYDYWAFENTPNFMRNSAGEYSKSPIFACERRGRSSRTVETTLDGKRAILQRCSKNDSQKGFWNIYYVTFPKMSVYNGQELRKGMFSLTVKFKSPSDLQTAKRIVNSLRFDK
jgi:hypothetical protein